MAGALLNELGDLMEKERNYEEIKAIGNSAESPSTDDVKKICNYFGMNGSSDKEIIHLNKLGIPINTIIEALVYGETRMNAYGDDPQITDIVIGDKNRKYALIIIGDCGKITGIRSAYPLDDFKQIKK